MNTVEKRREEILEEAKGAPLEIDYQVTEEAPILTVEAKERAEAELNKIHKIISSYSGVEIIKARLAFKSYTVTPNMRVKKLYT